MIQKLMKRKNNKGFTLIELIVVIAIIAILAAVLIPRMSGFTGKAQETQALVTAKSIATAFDSFVAEGKTLNAGFTQTEVLALAGNPSDGTLGSSLTASGAFTWTVTQTGKKAGRTVSGGALSPVTVIP